MQAAGEDASPAARCSPIHRRPTGTKTLIRCGRRKGYLEQRLGDRLIQHSRTIGATHLSRNRHRTER